MSDSKNLEVIRTNTVVKANALIQRSRYSLTLAENKIMLYLISQIKSTDNDFKLYEFNISDFCKLAGISYNGKNYNDLKEAIEGLLTKFVWIINDNGEETILRWIDKPYINKNSGIIKIKLDIDMKPYLLELKSNFTSYELIWTLAFKSKFTLRFYEVLKSIHYLELKPFVRQFSVDELKRMLGAEHYIEYYDFKRRALIPSIDEINNYSDKIVSYKEIKKGRKVIALDITVASKDIISAIKLKNNIQHKLGLDQITLWDTLEGI